MRVNIVTFLYGVDEVDEVDGVDGVDYTVEQAIEDFQFQLRDFNFCDVLYRVFPNDGVGYQSGNPHYKRRKTHSIGVNYPIFYTSKDKLEFKKKEQLSGGRHCVVLKDFFLEGKWPEGFELGSYEIKNEKFSKERDQLMQSHGIESEIMLFVHFSKDSFTGFFSIYSDLSCDKLMEKLNQPFVRTALDMCHFYMTRTYPMLINPTLYNGSIKPRALKILFLISEGMKFREIADELLLTERGVVYHYDTLRNHFNVKSKAELIKVAKENCIL